MGYVGDIAKVISGSAKNIPDAIERTALKSGVKAAAIGETQKLSEESIDAVSDAAYRATKYGIYGAAGLGAAGAIYDPETKETLASILDSAEINKRKYQLEKNIMSNSAYKTARETILNK